MNTPQLNDMNLHEYVARALQTQWPNFAAAHPHLAAAMDVPLLADRVTADLAADAEFQAALRQAAAQAASFDQLHQLLADWIAPRIAALLIG